MHEKLRHSGAKRDERSGRVQCARAQDDLRPVAPVCVRCRPIAFYGKWWCLRNVKCGGVSCRTDSPVRVVSVRASFDESHVVCPFAIDRGCFCAICGLTQICCECTLALEENGVWLGGFRIILLAHTSVRFLSTFNVINYSLRVRSNVIVMNLWAVHSEFKSIMGVQV